VNQKISILASESDPRVLADLTDDTKPLGFYGLTDWQVLKVSKGLTSFALLMVEVLVCVGDGYQSICELDRAVDRCYSSGEI